MFILPAHMPRKRAASGIKRKTPERSLQKRIATMLTWMLPQSVPWTAIAHGVFIPGDRDQAARIGANLKAQGLHRGWPDIHFIWKSKACYIELKAGSALSKAQKDVHPQIVSAGGVVRVCRSEEDVVDFLTMLGVPLQARLTPAERAVAGRRQ